MKTIEEKITQTLNASPDEVWQVIGAVDGVDKWFASLIKTCVLKDGKRFCETNEGVHFEEEILELNHETRTFRFAIPQQDMLPVTNIVETMKVLEGEQGTTIVEWSASFEATAENAEPGKESFRNLWRMGLKEMEQFINAKK